MKNNSIFFSIIIPTLNEEKNLEKLLSSIEKQDCKNYEVIIIDSFSKDKTKDVALEFKRKIPIKFIQKQNKTVSQARNSGAREAKGDFLIFFDADVEMGENHFISDIESKIKNFNLNVLTVWNRAKQGIKGKIIFGLMNLAMSFFQNIKPSANGPCIIVEKSYFERVNGFNEEIVFGEDIDLITKLVKAKAKFKVFSKPVLYVSTRRFEKEGLIKSLYKSITAIIYQLLVGPIKKPIFDYKMGGEYYENKN